MQVHQLDPASGALTPLQSLMMPEVIQYGWPNPARTMLYVATSGSGPMAKVKIPHHFVQPFAILPTGVLKPFQPPVRLGNRPLHLTLDRTEEHLLVAYNDPPDVTVHRITSAGGVGEQVDQPPLDFGVTVHQVRVTPPGTIAVVPACAHHASGVEA